MIDPAVFQVSFPQASANRTESQLPLSVILSTNVWMCRAAAVYNEFTRIAVHGRERHYG